MKRNFFIFPCVLFLAAACIKEDRTDCPCRLWLDFSDVDASVLSADIHLTSDNGFEFYDFVNRDDFEDYVLTVPREPLSLSVWSGTGPFLEHDMSVSIPYGEECPRLFLHKSDISAGGEVVKERIRLCKNHCVLTIQVESDEDYPFNLTVKGKVDGYGSNFKPTVGEFSCRAVPDSSGRCVVVIPRQLDSSLVLDVDEGSGMVKTFTLGETIVAGGYDWNAENLDDVTVKLDYALTEVVLEIVGWDGEHDYEVVI